MHTIALMPQSLTTEVMKEISGVAGTAIAMIGTLVGFIAGHTAGAAGKERADERAVTAMDQQMKVEKSIAALWGMDPEMMEKARQRLPDLYWG
jgi:hypothetical protein